MAADPLGLAAAPNDYAYVDNPFTIADPLGLMPAIHGPGGRWIRDPNTPVLLHNRDTEYPSSYRQSTHDYMTTNYTAEGIQQGGVPVYPTGHPSAGQRIPRSQLTWFNDTNNLVPMHRSQNSAGGGRMTATYRQDTGPNYSCT